MKKLILFLVLAIGYQLTNAQGFEGIIIYTISYENLPPEMEGHEAMLPKEYKVYIKNTQSRVESGSAMGTTVVINDMDANTSTVLMDMMGQKMKLSLSPEDIDKENAQNNTNIEYVNESKTIAGYQCKKALLKMEGDNPGDEAAFYYTEEIPAIQLQGFEGINLKGMPLEYSVISQGIKMIMTASKVEKSSVEDSMFDIPEGYTEMPESMKQKMKQQY